MWKKINQAFEKLVSLTDVFGAVMLLLILACCLIQAFARQANVSILWTEELARYSFVLLVFIGSIYSTRHVQHISTTMIIDRLPMSGRRYMDVLLQLGGALVNVVLFYSALTLFRNTTGVMRASALTWLRMRDFYLTVGIACLINALAALMRAAELLVVKDILLQEKAEAEQRTRMEEQQIIQEYESGQSGGGEAQ